MGDYGFRISKDGSDVKTCSDKDCVLTSKYSSLKGSTLASGSLSVVDSTMGTVTIAHGLGYIPFVKVFIKIPASTDFLNNYYQLPLWVDGIEDHIYARANADATNVYIDIEQWNIDSLTRIYYYSAYIFIDKGKI